MARSSFKAFIAIALACVILLSLAWVWLGKGYNSLVVEAVSPLVSSDVTLEQRGHDIEISAPPQAESESGTATAWDIHSMAMSYGLIVAASVFLALPGLRLRARLLLLLMAVLVGFVAHTVGLYVLVQNMESVARDAEQTLGTLPRTLMFAWLFVPSLVWLPALLRQWNPLRSSMA